MRYLRILFVLASFSVLGKEKQTLTIGTTSGYAPYVSLNTNGEYEGFDIDFARLLADQLDRKLIIRDLGCMSSLMVGLNRGKVDALIWAISITSERLKRMEMIYYQGEKVTSIPFLFWKTLPASIDSINDLIEKKICVESGSYQEEILRSTPDLELKYVDKITDALMELKFGKSDTVAVDPSLIPTLLKQFPELKVAYLPLAPHMQSLGNGVCIDLKNKELSDSIRLAIETLQREGKIRELEEKWITEAPNGI